VSKAAVETVMDALLANCERLDSKGPPLAAPQVARPTAVRDRPSNQVLSQMIATVECEEAMMDGPPDGPRFP